MAREGRTLERLFSFAAATVGLVGFFICIALNLQLALSCLMVRLHVSWPTLIWFMELNNDEIRRYSRHLILPAVGLGGQKKICSSSVLCSGAGGLGSPIAMYLAAAGIGKIGIVDFDSVDFSNLQRQIIHGTS